MTTLLVVRHGQTAWNRDERFRGRADLPLDGTGLKQAGAVAQRIAAGYQPAAILTSPLQRTVQTADAIGRHLGLEVEPHQGLLDLDYGDFSGLSPAEAQARYPRLYETWLAAPHMVYFPNGESLDQVRQRVDDLVDQVVEDHARQVVVLVSHLAVCRVLACSLLRIDNGHFWQFALEPAALTLYQKGRGAGRLVLWNDTGHLR